MAQNITLLGASYSDVPSVELPKTGGGTAQFDDTTIASNAAIASDITSGKLAFVNGELVTGTASGGGSTLITKSITANGTYNASSDNADGYSSVTVNVSGGGTYTATISGTGSASKCWVKVNNAGTAYYTNGDTFTYADGDNLYIRFGGAGAGGSYVNTLSVNGATIDSTTGSGQKDFTVTDPRCNMTIEMDYGQPTTVNLVVPSAMVASITANGIASIGGSAFASVAVPGMAETDLKYYIERSGSFRNITWPDGITNIGDYAFYGLAGFDPPALPDTITSIGRYAFYNCISVKFASLPSGITSIGQYAFYNCLKITLTSLPSGITSIGNYTFLGCSEITISSLPSSLTSIGSNAFTDCGKITVSTIPSSVTVINNGAFARCRSITSISCDGAITTLGSSAFTGDSSTSMQLTSASFPNLAVTSNLSTVFGSTTAASACQLLEFCDIGNAVGIAANSFANCNSLTKLVIRRSSVATLAATSAFTNTPMSGYNNLTGTVYVPSSLISSYQTATNWKTLYDAGTVTFSAIEGSDYELK